MWITPKRSPVPISRHFPFLSFPQPLATMNLLSVSIDLPVLDLSNRESYSKWSSVTGFFHSASCSQESSTL